MDEPNVDLRAAISRPFASRNVLWVASGLAVVDAASRLSGAVSTAVLVVPILIVAVLATGFMLTYSRNVALEDAPEFPDVSDVMVFARRGLSSLVAGLPGLVAALPVFLVIMGLGLVVTLVSDEPSVLFTKVAFFLFQWVVVVSAAPFVATYVIEDKIASAFEFRENLAAGWVNRNLLRVPVLFGIATAAIGFGTRRAAFLLTESPLFAPALESPPETTVGWLGPNLVATVAAICVLGVISGLIEIVAWHLWGQYARELYRRRLTV